MTRRYGKVREIGQSGKSQGKVMEKSWNLLGQGKVMEKSWNFYLAVIFL